MSDHQAKEMRMDMSLVILDVSEKSAYADGYEAQRRGSALGDGRKKFPGDDVKARQWTMGWGAAYADKGPAGFASGGIYTPKGPSPFVGEAIMPLKRDADGRLGVAQAKLNNHTIPLWHSMREFLIKQFSFSSTHASDVADDFMEQWREDSKKPLLHEAPISRDPSGPFCVIAKYAGRNFFKDMTGAVKHADKLLGRNEAKELLVTRVARVISREPEPKPPLRVRYPRPGEFA